MTIDTLTKSKDLYVLFDGCPTCHPKSSKYLNQCRKQAQKTPRKHHVVPSGSPTATMIRIIATKQGQPAKYPMILMDGTIHYNPQDITEETKK